jgi:hypothetical protein
VAKAAGRLWKEVDAFFAGRDAVHAALRSITKRLDTARLPYAVVGAMAVNLHGYRHMTDDVDLLLTPDGYAQFCQRFVGESYSPHPRRSYRVLDRETQMALDIVLSGQSPRPREPGPIVYPDPERVGEVVESFRVVNLLTLVELKLAQRRYRDLGDVAGLMRANGLDESYAFRLHPSVRAAYILCLKENQREAEFEAQQ